MSPVLLVLVAFIVGFALGMVVMAMFIAAGQADDDLGYTDEERP